MILMSLIGILIKNNSTAVMIGKKIMMLNIFIVLPSIIKIDI